MAMLDPDPKFWSKTSIIQLGYGVWVNLAYFALGLAHGFPAIQVPQLNHPDCKIPTTVNEISWIASVMTLFAPVGCILSGFLMDRFGRKPVIVASELPICIGWIYTAMADTALHIIIGRAITGIGCGMAMGAPRLYVAEISLANMRGVLGAFPNMFISLGMTIQATMGSFLPWKKISFICGGFNGCLLISYLLLTETPYFLLLRASEEKAKNALFRIRSKSYNVDSELQELLEFKEDNDIRSLSIKEKISLLCSNTCCKPFSILMMYVIIGVVSGISIITFWTVELLMSTKSSMDAYAGNVAINCTRLVFGILSSFFLYCVGRRKMAVMSAAGVGIVCVTLGTIVHYGTGPTVLPQILLMMYIAFSSLGFLCLPFLLMSELYPLQVRGILISVSISLTSILIFFSAKTYPYLRDNFGISNSFFMFGSFSILGGLFLYFFLPETKDLTLQEIEEYYNARRPTLVSGRRVLSAQLHSRPASATSGTPPTAKRRSSHSKAETSTKEPSLLERINLTTRAEKSSMKGSSSNAGARKSVSFSDTSNNE